jgi:hypothetical protein
MNRFRHADWHSEPVPIFDRHHFETTIDISSESLSTSVRNGYRHRPESAGDIGNPLWIARFTAIQKES